MFKNDKNSTPITWIDFDDSGEYCITSSPNDTLQMYDAVNGKQVISLLLNIRKYKTSYSKKYGCDLATFTHSRNNILHSSTKGDGLTIEFN